MPSLPAYQPINVPQRHHGHDSMSKYRRHHRKQAQKKKRKKGASLIGDDKREARVQ